MASISKLNLLFIGFLFFAVSSATYYLKDRVRIKLELRNVSRDLCVSVVDPEDCVYTMYVKTGSMLGAGTDSKISLILGDDVGQALKINDLKAWGGLMGGVYNYYERGNLDIFSGKAPCLAGNVCMMNITAAYSIRITSDWYCKYVEVTTTGAQTPCFQQTFTVEQWLSTKQLYATKDYCGLISSTGVSGDHRRLIIVDPENEPVLDFNLCDL